MPVNTTFNAHGLGSNVGDKKCESTLIRVVHDLRAIQALLTLALLHEKVVAAVAVKRELAASGATDALFGAAVGLKLWHEPDDLSGTPRKSKGKLANGMLVSGPFPYFLGRRMTMKWFPWRLIG